MSIPNNFLVKYALDKDNIPKENVDRALGDLFDVVRHLAEENTRLKADAEKKEAEYAALASRIASLEEEKRISAAKCETDEKSLRFYMAENQSLIEKLNMERSRNNGGFTNEEVFNSIAVMAEEMRRISAVNESVNERMEELGERMDSFIDNCTGRQYAYRYQNHPPYSDNVPAPQEPQMPEEEYGAPMNAEAEAVQGAGTVYAAELPQETAEGAEEPIPEEMLPDEGIPTEPVEAEVCPENGTDFSEIQETETSEEPEADPEIEVEIVDLPDTEPEAAEEAGTADLPDEPVLQELDIRMFDQIDNEEMPAEADAPADIPAEENTAEEAAEDAAREEQPEEEPVAVPEEPTAEPEEPTAEPEEPVAESEETPEENPEDIPEPESPIAPDSPKDAEKTLAISEIAEKLRRQAMQEEPAPEAEKPETAETSTRDSVYASLKNRLDRINQNSKFKK